VLSARPPVRPHTHGAILKQPPQCHTFPVSPPIHSWEGPPHDSSCYMPPTIPTPYTHCHATTITFPKPYTTSTGVQYILSHTHTILPSLWTHTHTLPTLAFPCSVARRPHHTFAALVGWITTLPPFASSIVQPHTPARSHSPASNTTPLLFHLRLALPRTPILPCLPLQNLQLCLPFLSPWAVVGPGWTPRSATSLLPPPPVRQRRAATTPARRGGGRRGGRRAVAGQAWAGVRTGRQQAWRYLAPSHHLFHLLPCLHLPAINRLHHTYLPHHRPHRLHHTIFPPPTLPAPYTACTACLPAPAWHVISTRRTVYTFTHTHIRILPHALHPHYTRAFISSAPCVHTRSPTCTWPHYLLTCDLPGSYRRGSGPAGLWALPGGWIPHTQCLFLLLTWHRRINSDVVRSPSWWCRISSGTLGAFCA